MINFSLEKIQYEQKEFIDFNNLSHRAKLTIFKNQVDIKFYLTYNDIKNILKAFKEIFPEIYKYGQ